MTQETPFVTFWSAINAHLSAQGLPALRMGDARRAFEAATCAAEAAARRMQREAIAQAR